MAIFHYLLPLLLLTSTFGVPVRYDQRQEGELNVHAHLENFIIVLIPSSSVSLLDFIPLKKQNTILAKPGTNEASNVPQGTGTKLSAPDFPAGKSPYKVDINESDGEETDEKEVLIAHVPSALLSSSQVKGEGEPVASTTLTSSDEESTTKLTEIVPPATDEVQNDVSAVNSDKKENTVQKTQIKEDKKDEVKTEMKEDKKDEVKTEVKEDKKDAQKTEVKEDKKDDQKTAVKEQMKDDAKPAVNDEKKEDKKTTVPVQEEKKEDKKTEVKEQMKDDAKPAVNDEKKTEENIKLDEVPVIDTVPGKPKPTKAPKSIEFGIEAAKPRVQNVAEDEPLHVIYSPRVKTFKMPTYRQEVVMDPPVGSDEYAKRLKVLRTGVDGCEPGEVMGDNGECLPAKFTQRNNNYFSSSSVDRLLPLLQFGVSPANTEDDSD